MGYYMNQRECDFRIRPENKAAALAALHAMTEADTGGGVRRWSWVDGDEVRRATTLEDALQAWRWNTDQVEEDGTISNIFFEGEKYGDDDQLFAALGPYVDRGSYIEMQGECGAIWRWTFDGTSMEAKDAKICWD